MYTRADISLEDRLDIFSRYWSHQGDYGWVSRLADEWQTSRRFIYDLAERVRHAVDWHRPGRPAEDTRTEEVERLRQRVQELTADVEQLQGQLAFERQALADRRGRLLRELAVCPVSEDKIVRNLEVAFGAAGICSVGWVSTQLQRAGAAALQIMQRTEVRTALREVALDELFPHQQPVLTLVEPHTMMAVVPEIAENRQGTTWQKVLEQYPNLEMVVSDQAAGLLKGVALRSETIVHQFDLFHFKRDLRRELRRLEARCYEAIEGVERARKLIDYPRLLDSARIQATVEYREKAAALDRKLEAFDWTEMILAYLEEALSPWDARRQRIWSWAAAQAVIDDVLELLSQVTAVDTRPLMAAIETARDGLLNFLRVLDERLRRIPIQWHLVEGSRTALCDALARCWYWQARAGKSRKGLSEYLAALIGLTHWQRRVENFCEVQAQVFQALDQVVRASSAVECLNSILRPYVSVKKHLSQEFLALIALYWNMHPLPERGGQTPFQLCGIDLGSEDWIEVLEHQMQKTAARADR